MWPGDGDRANWLYPMGNGEPLNEFDWEKGHNHILFFKDYVVWNLNEWEKAWKPYIQSKVKIW